MGARCKSQAVPWRLRRAQQPQAAVGQFAPVHFVRQYKKGADTVRYSAGVCPMTGHYNMLCYNKGNVSLHVILTVSCDLLIRGVH